MNRIPLILVFIFLIISCDIDKTNIIGQKFDRNDPPYGYRGFYGMKYINDKHYNVCAYYYRNKAIVYIINDDSYIIDYFFSNLYSDKKLKKLDIGTEYEKIISKLGEPVFLIFPYLPYYDINSLDGFEYNNFKSVYFKRRFNFSKFRYELDIYNNTLSFNILNNTLNYISKSRETDEGTRIIK